MSRTPSKLLTQSLQTPRERVWTAILAVGGGGSHFTVGDVQDRCRPMVNFEAVRQAMACFTASGHLSKVKASTVLQEHGNRHSTPLFELVNATPEAPRVTAGGKPALQGLGVLAMWRSMRVLSAFDFRDIAASATLAPLVVSEETARKYVDALYRAGYLQQMRVPTRQLPGRYRLKRYTGPHAPAITRRKAVLDRNTGEFAELETAQEVCDAQC